MDVLGAAVVLASAYLLFRPPPETHTLECRRRGPGADPAARLRRPADSLGYFATRRDKAVVWDTGEPSTARAGVSYRVVRLGEPGQRQPGGRPRGVGTRRSSAWRGQARASVAGHGGDGRRADGGAAATPRPG